MSSNRIIVDKPVDPSTISRDVLDTNNTPFETTIPSIREFVSRGCVRRAFLDAKIGPLKAELDKLFEERNLLDTEIRKHEGALSPLRRIPPEILSHILTLASPFTASVMNIEDGPWALSAVCGQWRSMVLAQPRLWTEIRLEFADSAFPTGLCSLIEAHLERSQKLPLTVKLSVRDEIDEEEEMMEETERAALDLVVAHCDRWETVELSGPTQLYESLAGSISGCLPILRKLDIRVATPSNESDDEDDEADISDLFESCPALQEAFINIGRYMQTPVVTIDLPRAQLLRYGAKNSWIEHVDVLSSAANLVDCVLHFIDPDDVSRLTSKIVLPQLRRLSTSTAAVLSCLEIPALQELYTCQSYNLPVLLLDLPNLQRLFVANAGFGSDAHLLPHAAPTIRNLFLYVPMDYAWNIFSLLDHTQRVTLSALETLSLCFVPSDLRLNRLGGPLDEDELMRAVEGQWQHGSLRTLRLYAMHFTPSAATLGRMEALRAQGMQIVLYKRSDPLYKEMVVPEFRVYQDPYIIWEFTHYIDEV